MQVNHLGVLIQGQPLRVAMPVGPDALTCPIPERVAVGNATIGVDTQGLAQFALQVLGRIAVVEALPGRQQQGAIGQEQHAPAIVLRGIFQRLQQQDLLNLFQGVFTQPGARNGGTIRLRGAMCIGQVHEAVGLELRMQHDIEKTSLSCHIGLGNAAQPGNSPIGRHPQQLAAPLGDEKTGIG